MLSASGLGRRLTIVGPAMTLPSAVMCGNRLKCWNTMPVAARNADSSRSEYLTRLPSPKRISRSPTQMLPRSGSSSRLMQRKRVDLPEPLGPIIATTEPRSTCRDTPLSTWTAPNAFHRSAISITAPNPPTLVRPGEPALDLLRCEGQREQHEKIDDRDDRI